jgi:hypothetical protein
MPMARRETFSKKSLRSVTSRYRPDLRKVSVTPSKMNQRSIFLNRYFGFSGAGS